MKYRLIEPKVQQDLSAIERVLTNRGIALEDIQHYLNTTAADVRDPGTIDRIHQGAQMLMKHIVKNDKIFIQVDSDADGFTSAAFLINYLNCLFPTYVQNNIQYRLHTGKQHGLIEEIIPELILQNISLVIMPDASSNDYDLHKELSEVGIDVLVIDHHEAEKISEYACIINNQLCDYPTKSLSGVGMVYKFCSYLDKIQEFNYADNFLDLVAVGLIADMMDLRDFETRFLINEGLKNIRNPFLKEICKVQNYQIEKHDGLNPYTVGFYIAPLINAVTRVGTQSEKLLLFQSMLDYKGYEQIPSTKRGCAGQFETRVEQACRVIKNVKNRQTKTQDEILAMVEHMIKEEKLLRNKILVICLDQNIDANLTGLIANQVAAKYQHPTLLLNDKDELWSGSGRNFAYSPLADFRNFCNETELIEFAQGHASAFGFAIRKINLNKFIELTNELLYEEDFQTTYDVDFIWSTDNLSGYSIFELARGQWIWGQEISKPLVAIENVKVYPRDMQLMKGSTLKINLPNGVNLIKFGSSEEEYDSLYSEMGYVTITVIGECKENIWNGVRTPQIEVKDFEITGVEEYYF